ncbi:FtsB family cell division protein [Enorma phocaeensis]|uniref:FtsB family cell division protein n=2 Tax=Enorma phocaeensis TaxID=1871019 RepID=UPI001FEC912D|nr:septum formation initiator family protein [Enorma phocaeensis]
MGTYQNNRTARGRTRDRAASAATTGDLSAAATRLRATSSSRAGGAGASSSRRSAARRGASSRTSPRRSTFMRYAADNRVVQFIYSLTTGSAKPFFYAAVVVAVLVSIYFPVRDLYSAYRTGIVLEQQLQIRSAYNEDLESRVDSLLSTEGIERAAREDLGLVMPGERVIDVVGLDEGSSSEGDASSTSGDSAAGDDSASGTASGSASDDSEGQAGEGAADSASSEDDASADGGESAGQDGPMTSTDVEQAEQAALADAPWYIKMLDALFFYQGADGQAVASSGE